MESKMIGDKLELERVKKKFNQHKLLLLIVGVAIVWFFLQRANVLYWDFSVYQLNAKYLFSDGFYFEPRDDYLITFIMGLGSFLVGWPLVEYFYIFIAVVLFAFSSYVLADTLDLNPLVFITLSLNLYVLRYGLSAGTELLTYSFLELFAASLLAPDRLRFRGFSTSGIWMALAVMARMSSIVFLPLYLLKLIQSKGKIKDFLTDVVGFFGLWLPLLVFSFYKFGNMFATVANKYAKSVVYASYMREPIVWSQFVRAYNFIWPLFLVGFSVFILGFLNSIYNLRDNLNLNLIQNLKKIRLKLSDFKQELFFLLFLLIGVYYYLRVPISSLRYLFPIVLPGVFFSTKGLERLRDRLPGSKETLAKVIVLAVFSLSLAFGFYTVVISEATFDDPSDFKKAINLTRDLNLSDCALMSNYWVYLDYYGRPTLYPPREKLMDHYLNQGYKVLLIKDRPGPNYLRDSKALFDYPVVYNSDNFTIFGKEGTCKPIEKIDQSYLEQVNQSVYLMHNYSINRNPCDILFLREHEGFIWRKMAQTCNLVNFKDSNYKLTKD